MESLCETSRDSRVSRNAQQLPRISAGHPLICCSKRPEARMLESGGARVRDAEILGGDKELLVEEIS